MKRLLHNAFTCCLPSALPLSSQPHLLMDQVRSKLGVPGRTKDGHDCFVHYDKDCTAVESGPKAQAAPPAPPKPFCHPFDPNCGKIVSSAPAAVAAPKGSTVKDGIILPHPDCDPELDYNCRLRRADDTPAADQPAAPADQPPQEPAAALRFEDFLRGVMAQHQ